jgi:SOS regulatory protein LexA
MTKKLTRRQAGIYRYIVNYIEANNYPPTVREIADEFEIKSTNGVSEHIKALVRKGLLAKDSSKSRALRPLMTMEELGIDASELEGNDAFRRRACVSSNLDKKRPSKHKEPACERLDSARVKEIPLLGQIAAGTPILAEQNIDDQILVDANLFGRGQDRLYALRVRGTSMIGDGIMRNPVGAYRVILIDKLLIQGNHEHILFQKPLIKDGPRIAAESVNHLIVNELPAFLSWKQHKNQQSKNQCYSFPHRLLFPKVVKIRELADTVTEEYNTCTVGIGNVLAVRKDTLCVHRNYITILKV